MKVLMASFQALDFLARVSSSISRTDGFFMLNFYRHMFNRKKVDNGLSMIKPQKTHRNVERVRERDKNEKEPT